MRAAGARLRARSGRRTMVARCEGTFVSAGARCCPRAHQRALALDTAQVRLPAGAWCTLNGHDERKVHVDPVVEDVDGGLHAALLETLLAETGGQRDDRQGAKEPTRARDHHFLWREARVRLHTVVREIPQARLAHAVASRALIELG